MIPNDDHSPVLDAMPIKDAVLAMAYVPLQKFGTVYGEEDALKSGTLFAALDKPFTAGEKR